MVIKDHVYFHEDFYCQQELLPIQNLLDKRNEIKIATEKSDEAFTGEGFSSIYIINEAKCPLDRLNIKVVDFENILQEHALFRFDQVFTGYSSYRELKKHTYAFGYENYALYYTLKGSTVATAWINYTSFSDALNCYPERLKHTLYKLGFVYDLILMDWPECVSVTLKNEQAITNYFKFRLDV